MNENNDNFGLDSIQPLEPVTPVSETNTNVFGVPNFYVEPMAEEQNIQHAFTSEEPPISVEPEMPNISSAEISAPENTYNNYAENSEIGMGYSANTEVSTFAPEMPNVSPIENSVEENVSSYIEMPTMDSVQQPMVNDVNEHPNAKIELHKEMNDEIPVDSNLPREKMDKGTFWLLICLFVGLLAVIIALPYVFDLF